MKQEPINSYSKHKLIAGKSYWTFYMETTNSGNSLRKVTGVFEVVPVKLDTSGYAKGDPTSCHARWEWDIKGGGFYNTKHTANIETYMNGYGIATTEFYETESEAIEAHDKQIKELAKGQNTDVRRAMFTKLIGKVLPEVPKIEKDSIAWYKKLSKEQKKYISWIKEFYEDVEYFSFNDDEEDDD